MMCVLLLPIAVALSSAPSHAAPDTTDVRRAEIAAALDAGRAARAHYLASVWLREDPFDPERWVAMALATDDPREAEPLLSEALRLNPGHQTALVALARALTSQGRGGEAAALLQPLIDAGPDDPLDVWVALADARRDPAPAKRALADRPGHPDAALAVARWTADPAEARSALASVAEPDRRVLAARIELALRTGARDAAGADLDALRALAPGRSEAERLSRWLGCLEAGTVNPEVLGALLDARRRALADPVQREPHLAEIGALASHAARCPAALALRAMFGGPDARIADLEAAVALAPDDSGLAAALGDALLADGQATEAIPWLTAAAAARSFEPPTALARALAAAGEVERARGLLDDAAPAFPDDVSLALARADLAPDRQAAFEVLVTAVARTSDPVLLARARTLAEVLDEAAALETVLRGSRALPPVGDEVSEEIVVVAKGSRERLKELTAHIRELGYGESRVLGNGDVYFATQGLEQPSVTLHPDGSYDIMRAGVVPVKRYPWLSDDELDRLGVPKWDRKERRIAGERILWRHRERLIEELGPDLVAWREAICAEGLENRLLHEIPGTLDAVWRDGVARDGAVLATPEARRAALLEWWVTRTCTLEGEAVRSVIARYLEREVQPSPWPVTKAELAAVNERRSCPGALALSVQ